MVADSEASMTVSRERLMITMQEYGDSRPEERWRTRTDASTFRLQQQFRQAHGACTGELTTLVTSVVDGGVFVSGIERRQ